MAAGRDIARHTALLRKQQLARNLEAVKAEEERRADADRQSKMAPGDLRKELAARRGEQRRHARDGHKLTVLDTPKGGWLDEDDLSDDTDLDDDDEDWDDEEEKMDVVHEDKMDRGDTMEDKSGITFASRRARNMMIKLRLHEDALRPYAPSNEKGYTVGDVRRVKADLKE